MSGSPRGSDPEVLMEHAGWVRALARHLVGDEHAADDVAQETWVAALRHPPSQPADVPRTRAWLGRVAKNFARRAHRSEGRRRVRERAAARPEAIETTPGERFEQHRELVLALNELDAGPRELLVLRYFDGLPPREIAERMGLGDVVVRKRLSRALEALRRRLDSRHRGERWAWCASFETAFGPGAVTVIAETGGSIVTGKIIAGGALAVLLAALFISSRDGENAQADPDPESRSAGEVAPEPSDPALEPAGVGAGEGREVASATEERTDAGAPEPSAPGAADEAAWIEGRVVVPRGAVIDASLAVLSVSPAPAADTMPPWVVAPGDSDAIRYWLERARWHERDRVPVAADGTFRLERPAGRAVHLTVEGCELLLERPETIGLPPAGPVELRPELGASVHGRLDIEAGVEVEGVAYLIPKVENLDLSALLIAADGLRVVDLSPEGDFSFDAVEPGRPFLLRVRPKSLAPCGQETVFLEPGERLVTTVALEDGIVLRGVVRDDAGEPIADARVMYECTLTREGWRPAAHLSDKEVRTDAEGRYEMRGVPLGGTYVRARRDGYMQSGYRPLADDAGEEVDFDLVLKRGHSLGGVVRWEDGEPAAGARVEIGIDPGVGAATLGRGGFVTTDAAGRFLIGGLGQGTYGVEVQFELEGARGWARLREVEGDRDDLEVVLQPLLSLAGTVHDDEGRPLKQFEVEIARDARDRIRGVTTKPPRVEHFHSADGSFRIEGLPGGRWHILARAPGHAASRGRQVEAADGADVELVCTRAATIRGVVLTPDGDPAAGAEVATGEYNDFRAALRSPSFVTTIADEVGRFELGGVLAGDDVKLVARRLGSATSALRTIELGVGEVREDIELSLRPAGTVRGVVQLSSGEPAPLCRMHLECADERYVMSTYTKRDGSFSFHDLPAGAWKLHLHPSWEMIRATGLDPVDPKSHPASKRTEEFDLSEGEEKTVLFN